ncbi:MAG: hypothetical protein WAK86_14380 [Pseudonocardiaceae bacterium]
MIAGSLASGSGAVHWSVANITFAPSDVDVEVTLVPQDPYMFGRSIRDNVTLGAEVSAEAV